MKKTLLLYCFGGVAYVPVVVRMITQVHLQASNIGTQTGVLTDAVISGVTLCHQ